MIDQTSPLDVQPKTMTDDQILDLLNQSMGSTLTFSSRALAFAQLSASKPAVARGNEANAVNAMKRARDVCLEEAKNLAKRLKYAGADNGLLREHQSKDICSSRPTAKLASSRWAQTWSL